MRKERVVILLLGILIGIVIFSPFTLRGLLGLRKTWREQAISQVMSEDSTTTETVQKSKILVRADMCFSARCRDFTTDLQKTFEQSPKECLPRDIGWDYGAVAGVCSDFVIFIGEARNQEFDFEAIIIGDREGARPRLVNIYGHPDNAFRKLWRAMMGGL